MNTALRPLAVRGEGSGAPSADVDTERAVTVKPVRLVPAPAPAPAPAPTPAPAPAPAPEPVVYSERAVDRAVDRAVGLHTGTTERAKPKTKRESKKHTSSQLSDHASRGWNINTTRRTAQHSTAQHNTPTPAGETIQRSGVIAACSCALVRVKRKTRQHAQCCGPKTQRGERGRVKRHEWGQGRHVPRGSCTHACGCSSHSEPGFVREACWRHVAGLQKRCVLHAQATDLTRSVLDLGRGEEVPKQPSDVCSDVVVGCVEQCRPQTVTGRWPAATATTPSPQHPRPPSTAHPPVGVG